MDGRQPPGLTPYISWTHFLLPTGLPSMDGDPVYRHFLLLLLPLLLLLLPLSTLLLIPYYHYY